MIWHIIYIYIHILAISYISLFVKKSVDTILCFGFPFPTTKRLLNFAEFGSMRNQSESVQTKVGSPESVHSWLQKSQANLDHKNHIPDAQCMILWKQMWFLVEAWPGFKPSPLDGWLKQRPQSCKRLLLCPACFSNWQRSLIGSSTRFPCQLSNERFAGKSQVATYLWCFCSSGRRSEQRREVWHSTFFWRTCSIAGVCIQSPCPNAPWKQDGWKWSEEIGPTGLAPGGRTTWWCFEVGPTGVYGWPHQDIGSRPSP